MEVSEGSEQSVRWGHRIVLVAAMALFWWVASDADQLSTFSVLALPIAGLAVVSFSILRTIDESDGVVIRVILVDAALAVLAVVAWTNDVPRSTRVMVAESCLRSAHDGDPFDCGGWTGSMTATTNGRYYDIDNAAAELVLSPDAPTPSPSPSSFAPTYRHLYGDWYLRAPWGAP